MERSGRAARGAVSAKSRNRAIAKSRNPYHAPVSARSFILGLDQGTTSSRAILFDQSGKPRGAAQKEFQQFFPRPGWVEHDPMEIWMTQRDVMLQAIRGFESKVAAIGITNQRETTVVWDRRTGQPIHRAIVWQDRRTSEQVAELRNRGLEPLFHSRTGLVLDPYFSGTKLSWILDQVPDARVRAEAGDLAFGTIDSWLVWNLTGGAVHCTDVSNASRTMLFDIHKLQWDEELLEILRIPRALLPEVRGSSEVVGETSAHEGLPGHLPIAGIAGDQQAALFGQRCTQPGMAKNTYGTGCFLVMNTGSRVVTSENRLLGTIAWKIKERVEYGLEGSIFVAGAAVQWLRDGLGIIRSAAEVEALAASVGDSGGVVMVPAFAGLGAPQWDPYARGALLGLTRGSSAAHIARATLEAIAFQVADVLELMGRDSGIALKELRVDGAATVNNLLMQFQADILGIPVVRSAVAETTVLGAAYLAGLSVGMWSAADLDAQWRGDRTFAPKMDAASRAAARAKWTRAVDRSRNWETP